MNHCPALDVEKLPGPRPDQEDNGMKMSNKIRRPALGLAVAALTTAMFFGFLALPRAASAIDLGDLLGSAVKVVGVKALIDQFGSDINKTINKLLDNNDAKVNASTKVVTIVSPIGNKHIGACQVAGPKAAVDKVGAVVQLETSFMDKTFRLKALIPIEGSDPTRIKRVEGVGVSAIIDIKL
jgi:hypothetical protein